MLPPKIDVASEREHHAVVLREVHLAPFAVFEPVEKSGERKKWTKHRCSTSQAIPGSPFGGVEAELPGSAEGSADGDVLCLRPTRIEGGGVVVDGLPVPRVPVPVEPGAVLALALP